MLVTMMPSVLAVDAEGSQSEFTFPLRYDAEKMAAADGDSVVLADYGITGRALWTVKRGTAYDLPKIGYGVRNSGITRFRRARITMLTLRLRTTR